MAAGRRFGAGAGRQDRSMLRNGFARGNAGSIESERVEIPGNGADPDVGVWERRVSERGRLSRSHRPPRAELRVEPRPCPVPIAMPLPGSGYASVETVSRTSSGAGPASASEASSRRGAAPGTQGEEVRAQLPRPLAAMQPPQLPHPHPAVAFGLALVGVRDLDLRHQVRRDTLDAGIEGLIPRVARPEAASGALRRRRTGSRAPSRAGRFAAPPKPGAADSLRCTGGRAPGDVHDTVQDPGQSSWERDGAVRAMIPRTGSRQTRRKQRLRSMAASWRRRRRRRAGRAWWSRGGRCARWRESSWRGSRWETDLPP